MKKIIDFNISHLWLRQFVIEVYNSNFESDERKLLKI